MWLYGCASVFMIIFKYVDDNCQVYKRQLPSALMTTVEFVDNICQRSFDHNDSFKWFLMIESKQGRNISSIINQRYQIQCYAEVVII